MQRLASTAALASGLFWGSQAHADRAVSKVAEFSAGGLVFKDKVEIVATTDPKVDGITIYVSSVKRALSDRLKGDIFADPSSASVSCVQTGPIKILQQIAQGPEGEEVFSVKRNLLFKNTHVRRVYDADRNALIYVSYSSRLTQDMNEPNSRYRTSVSAISLYGQDVSVGARQR